jgi:hypothetical protein
MRKQSAVQWPSHLSIPPHEAWVWLLHTWTKCSEIKHKTSPRRCSRRSVCMHKHTHTGKRRLWVCLFALSCDGLRHARVTIPLVACLCPPTNIKYECTHGSCVLYDDVCWDTPTIIFIPTTGAARNRQTERMLLHPSVNALFIISAAPAAQQLITACTPTADVLSVHANKWLLIIEWNVLLHTMYEFNSPKKI